MAGEFFLDNIPIIMTPLLYISFAILSTIVNLISQEICFQLYHGFFDIYVAMFFGTLNGLILKYVLDKKYIFQYQTKNIKEDGSKFFLYSLMGVFTTIIFWAFELSFDFLFDHQYAKYAGALIGLSIGYLIKYLLDKKFVFTNNKMVEGKNA